MTAAELARELYEVRSQIADLKTKETDLSDRLAAEMPEQTLEVPGIGVFERRRKSERKAWDNEALSSALLRKLRSGEVPKLTDPETGEVINEDDTERAFRILNECARPSWRLTPLRKLNLDPDEFSSVTYSGGFSIQYHGSFDE